MGLESVTWLKKDWDIFNKFINLSPFQISVRISDLIKKGLRLSFFQKTDKKLNNLLESVTWLKKDWDANTTKTKISFITSLESVTWLKKDWDIFNKFINLSPFQISVRISDLIKKGLRLSFFQKTDKKLNNLLESVTWLKKDWDANTTKTKISFITSLESVTWLKKDWDFLKR